MHAMHAPVVHVLSRAAQQYMQPPIPEGGFSRANSTRRMRNGSSIMLRVVW
jgi:hypothetical protein